MTDLFRAATLAPATLDRAAMTVEAVAVSGYAPVVQRGMPAPDGSPAPWIEELDAAGADLASFTGAPLLRDHRPTTDSQVGVVLSARVEPGAGGPQLVAKLRFSTKPAAVEMFNDVAAGILRGVSAGYRVVKYASAGVRDGLKVFRATAWQPFELSLTPRPADAGALTRSLPMPDDTPPNPVATPEAPVVAVPPAGNENRAPVNGEIRTMVRSAGLPVAFADGLIDQGATLDQARAATFTEMQRRGVMLRTESVVQVGDSGDDPAVKRRHMATALAARIAPGLVKPDDAARQYMGYRSLDLAGELAQARGERFNRHDQEALFRAATHSTSDFPLLLQDAGNMVLMASYALAAPSYRKIAAPRPFADFKPHQFLSVGDFPGFKKIPETGEIKFGTFSENRETITADEYVSAISISRKALMNDSLSALGDFSNMIARRAASDENAMVYSVIAGNGRVMSDGKALFHADHGNKAAAGGAITVTTVAAARAAMRKQTGLDGLVLNVEGTLLVVGPDKELEARQLVASITAAKASDANPWSGSFEVIVDAQITGNRWYIFANPGQLPVLGYGYVSGNDGPQILTERDFDTQGIKVRAGLDFAFGATDFRGAYLNEGA